MQAKAENPSLDVSAMKWHADVFHKILKSKCGPRPGISGTSWLSTSGSHEMSFRVKKQQNLPGSTIRQYSQQRRDVPETMMPGENQNSGHAEAEIVEQDLESGNFSTDRIYLQTQDSCKGDATAARPGSSMIPGRQDYELSRILFTNHPQAALKISRQLDELSKNLIMNYERVVPMLQCVEGKHSSSSAIEALIPVLQSVSSAARRRSNNSVSL
jgi:hypothetical protein